eukprot:CAMPEP_0201559362 /NCGR_PEP_ID=MMETSP0173_2-20130828/73459_1 /ASSEMBLY_ACC=CAM_ASM_000268 /TAXON_ID=218659 /ORGANISM="Vexillifera sp., Strain DIVA3 564/2" /LENGTH=88 /DNA_ID=CAMNT_0047973299 /DNA_START=281 /DNA_END=544 /DNA_ORIENTATION=+
MAIVPIMRNQPIDVMSWVFQQNIARIGATPSNTQLLNLFATKTGLFYASHGENTFQMHFKPSPKEILTEIIFYELCTLKALKSIVVLD